MSREVNEVRRLLAQRLQQVANGTLYGRVEAVNEKRRTCDVRIGGVVYQGVLLYAIEQDQLKGTVIIPSKGSGVLVSRIAGGNRLYVAMFSVIDKIVITIGDKQVAEFSTERFEIQTDQSTLRLTQQGMVLKRGDAGLKKSLGDLCDALSNLTVTTPHGPSTTPINATDFQKIKQELNKYLTE